MLVYLIRKALFNPAHRMYREEWTAEEWTAEENNAPNDAHDQYGWS